MTLSELINGIEYKVIGDLDIDVKEVVTDSKAVNKDSLFICINGENFDSHNFASQVERYGACALVVEREFRDA